MNNLDSLSLQFARDFPGAFVRAIARFNSAEICTLLSSMPNDIAAGVAAHFSSHRMSTVLATGQVKLDAWLEAAQFEDAVAILGLLPREQSMELVKSLENRTLRRRLLQYLSYPAHTVGALVSEPLVRIRHDLSITEILQELKSYQSLARQPTLVIEQDGKYLGILKLWQIASRSASSGVARDFSDRIEPIRPESPLANAVQAEQWRHHHCLPVVDHERRVLGVISQNQIIGSLGEKDALEPSIQNNLIVLGEQYLKFMAGMLSGLLHMRRLP